MTPLFPPRWMPHALLVAVAASSSLVAACGGQTSALGDGATAPDGAATADASNVTDSSNPVEAGAFADGIDEGGAAQDAIATDVEAGPGSGTCQYPAGVESAGDASSPGCFVESPGHICQVSSGAAVNVEDGEVSGGTETCATFCGPSEYQVTCSDVDQYAILGCRSLGIPLPRGVGEPVCCPCVGTGDAEVVDSGAAGEAFDAPADASAVDVGTDGDSASCLILASNYDQSCTVDSDCQLVMSCDTCSVAPPLGCTCGGAAVNADAAEQFWQAVQNTPLGRAMSVPGNGIGSSCPLVLTAPAPCCRQGTCQGKPGACMSPVDTLPACADAGGACEPLGLCISSGPPDSCANADEACCLPQ
ncbi:MAG: hypothetical protein ABTD50_21865 [Polyangiaceae bacterium]|jgi:hypothetical protein